MFIEYSGDLFSQSGHTPLTLVLPREGDVTVTPYRFFPDCTKTP